MELSLTPEDQAFQQEVRDFLKENLTPDLVNATRRTTTVFVEKHIALEWQRILHRKGWLAYFWPEQYGGPGWTSTQRYIFQQECAAHDAPGLIPMGLRYVGPVIFTFGDDWQKEYFLPRILSGEHYWCQGYSEPGAGSDLASLKTRAVRDGDDYVLNGTKIWTTHAHHADWIFVLARTQDAPKKQQGISFILVDMKSPGITVTPIITMGMDHEVNQVFFDDVRVPAKNLIGEDGKGWDYAKFLLQFERGGGASGGLKNGIRRLKSIAAKEAKQGTPLIDDDHYRRELSKVEVDVMALEMTELRIMSSLASGQPPGPESSVLNGISTSVSQRMSELAVEAVSHYAIPLPDVGLLYETNEFLPGPDHAHPVMGAYLNRRAASIFGGSDEIQRDIIAKAVLGL